MFLRPPLQVMPTTTKHSATESGTGTGGCAAAPVDAPSVAVPGAKGQRRPGFQASSGLDVFSYYEYYPSEYSAEVARRDQSVARRESKDKCAHPPHKSSLWLSCFYLLQSSPNMDL